VISSSLRCSDGGGPAESLHRPQLANICPARQQDADQRPAKMPGLADARFRCGLPRPNVSRFRSDTGACWVDLADVNNDVHDKMAALPCPARRCQAFYLARRLAKALISVRHADPPKETVDHEALNRLSNMGLADHESRDLAISAAACRPDTGVSASVRCVERAQDVAKAGRMIGISLTGNLQSDEVFAAEVQKKATSRSFAEDSVGIPE
jgi:hypothetical protein